MAAFLKIENPGVAPAEAFTLLGASTKRGGDERTIGQFGSGNKHGVAVLLRNDMAPIVFAGNLKMEFSTRPQIVDDGLRESNFNRVLVKFGGKDESGKNRSSTEDLGFVLEYGASDWGSVDLALREFVSNSLDRAKEQAEYNFAGNWLKKNDIQAVNGRLSYDDQSKFDVAMKEFRKGSQFYKDVVVEIVNENQVRAKSGHTRVFVPLTAEVTEFYNNIGKWFLHFSEPESLDKTILPKRNRNFNGRKAAVIYRRGVRVREFESSEVPSLFDYNLNDLQMDEARKVDDWRVRNAAGAALIDGGKEVIAKLMQTFLSEESYWEHEFDGYSLEPWNDPLSKSEARAKVWAEAFDKIAGTEAVITNDGGGVDEILTRKGYKVVKAPKAFVKAAEKYGVRTADKVLSQDDRDGLEIVPATPDAQAACDYWWGVIERLNLTNGRQKPPVFSFHKSMDAGTVTNGFWREGKVYIGSHIAADSVAKGGSVATLSQKLMAVALEELGHHVTGALDNSRDFQDWFINLCVKLGMEAGGNAIHIPLSN